MSRSISIPTLFLLLATAAFAAEAPQVSATVPAEGAADVPCDLEAVVVSFDRDMSTAGYSVFACEEGEAPAIQGIEWRDARTLVITIDRLDPSTSYALQLNNRRRQRVKSAEGVPLEPRVLRFTTSATPAPAGTEDPVPERQPVEEDPVEDPPVAPAGDPEELPIYGRWRAAAGSPLEGIFELVLYPGDNWAALCVWGGKTNLVHGAMIARPGFFVPFAPDGAETSLYGAAPDDVLAGVLRAGEERPAAAEGFQWIFATTWNYRMDGDDLLLVGDPEAGETGSLRLVRQAPRATGALATTWEPGQKGTRRTLVFGADGSMTGNSRVFGVEVEFAGRWELADGEKVELHLDATADKEAATESYGLVVIDAAEAKSAKTTLILLEPGADAQVFHGVVGGGSLSGSLSGTRPPVERPEEPEPATSTHPIVGHWIVRAAEVSADLVFSADGRYTREWTEEGETERFGGTWAVAGSTLEVVDEGEGKLSLPFTLKEGVLTLTIDGEKVPFLRADGGAAGVPSELCGTWSAEDASGALALELKETGLFTLKGRDGQEAWSRSGRWTATDAGAGKGRIDLHDPLADWRYSVPYRLAGGSLFVTLEGEELELGSGSGGGGASGGSAQSLVGMWRGRRETTEGKDHGVLTLTLSSGGQASAVWEIATARLPFQGSYRVQGTQLTLDFQGEAAMTMEYSFEGGKLVLDHFPDMKPTTMERIQ